MSHNINICNSQITDQNRYSNSNARDTGECENCSQDVYFDELEHMKSRENKRSCATTTFLLAIDIFTIALIVILFSKVTVKNGTFLFETKNSISLKI